MLKSMTGYGKVVKNYQNYNVAIELKSLNAKNIELQLRLPNSLKHLEIDLRNLLTKHIVRGKTELTIAIDIINRQPNMLIDTAMIDKYINQLTDCAVKNDLQLTKKEIFSMIFSCSDIMSECCKEHETNTMDSEIAETIHAHLLQTIAEYDKFRCEEGNVLNTKIKIYVKNILTILAQIEQYEKKRIDDINERMHSNLQKSGNIISDERLMQEMFFYIEKLDVTEEKVRLQQHCDYFLATMEEEEGSGKKLGFIAQEMGREINTLGSKANNYDMQKIVVDMKDELEKIKEQLLNIL